MAFERRARRAAICSTAVLALICLHPLDVAAQALSVGDPLEDYLRLLQIMGQADLASFTQRPLVAAPAAVRGSHPWAQRMRNDPEGDGSGIAVATTDAVMRLFVNSSFPVGQNDGAVWQGKGLTAAWDAGATATWSVFSATLRPTLIFNQNAEFELHPVAYSGVPPYAYPLRRIDLPQRFGPNSYWTLDGGQSEIRVRTHPITVAFGTAGSWWGPAMQNAIVVSNNAPGFPHVSAGTNGAVNIGIGTLEAQWFWGRLETSDWFDPAYDERERFITAIVGSYTPSFLRGLTVGMTRAYYGWLPDDGTPARYYFFVFWPLRKAAFETPQNPEANDSYDQMLSLFARWVIPEGGFEVYAEWARNDHAWDVREFLLSPEHSQGYTLGLQKAIALPNNRLLALKGEITHLDRSATIQWRATPTYYAHHIVVPGYTQRGQIIGAGIGPGSNAQGIGVDLYDSWGEAGIYLKREARDNDAYYLWAQENEPSYSSNDVVLTAGAHGLVFTGAFELGGGLALVREWNRFFDGRDLWNLNLELSARWRPR